MTENLDYTQAPRHAKVFSKTPDEETKLTFTVLSMPKSGDFIAVEGPAREEFFNRGPNTSFVTCTKDWVVLYKKDPEGEYDIWPKKAFEAPNYSGNRSYGPFVIVSHYDDAYYVCIQHEDKYKSLDYEIVELKKGDKIDTRPYAGWNLAVIDGQLGKHKFGAFLRVKKGRQISARKDSVIVFVRVADRNEDS